MKAEFHRPDTYLITSGSVTRHDLTQKRQELLLQIKAAVDAGISLVQIREKELDTRSLFSLVKDAVEITGPSHTKLLVNDRVDVAVAAGADGVHLASRSIPVSDVRRAFGQQLTIGVSTHTMQEAIAAEEGGADLIVFGPVFQSPGKGDAVGLELLSAVCGSVDIPVFGLGGIDEQNFRSVLNTGAGIAGIRCFQDSARLGSLVRAASFI